MKLHASHIGLTSPARLRFSWNILVYKLRLHYKNANETLDENYFEV